MHNKINNFLHRTLKIHFKGVPTNINPEMLQYIFNVCVNVHRSYILNIKRSTLMQTLNITFNSRGDFCVALLST